jgi:hypothetical protein
MRSWFDKLTTNGGAQTSSCRINPYINGGIFATATVVTQSIPIIFFDDSTYLIIALINWVS